MQIIRGGFYANFSHKTSAWVIGEQFCPKGCAVSWAMTRRSILQLRMRFNDRWSEWFGVYIGPHSSTSQALPVGSAVEIAIFTTFTPSLLEKPHSSFRPFSKMDSLEKRVHNFIIEMKGHFLHWGVVPLACTTEVMRSVRLLLPL